MTLHLINQNDRTMTRCGLTSHAVTTLNSMPTYPPHVAELCDDCAAAEPGLDAWRLAFQCDAPTFKKLRNVHSVMKIQSTLSKEQRDELVSELGLIIGQFRREVRS